MPQEQEMESYAPGLPMKSDVIQEQEFYSLPTTISGPEVGSLPLGPARNSYFILTLINMLLLALWGLFVLGLLCLVTFITPILLATGVFSCMECSEQSPAEIWKNVFPWLILALILILALVYLAVKFTAQLPVLNYWTKTVLRRTTIFNIFGLCVGTSVIIIICALGGLPGFLLSMWCLTLVFEVITISLALYILFSSPAQPVPDYQMV